MPYPILGPLALRDFRRQSQRCDRDDSHERLHQQQRGVLRFPRERSVSMQSAPRGNHGKRAKRGCSLPPSETKGRPDEKRNAQILKGVVLKFGMERLAKDRPAGGEQPDKQESQLRNLLVSPIQAGVLPPKQKQ